MTAFWEGAITAPIDVEQARREARQHARALGFDALRSEALTLATVELAMNLIRFAVGGRLRITEIADGGRLGLQIESRDDGPGIRDVDAAMTDGYSTGNGLGNGLPGVRRLMDTFAIQTAPAGTTITARKWRH